MKLSSAHAIDAFAVATALLLDTAVIAAGDPKDIQRLAGTASKTQHFFALKAARP